MKKVVIPVVVLLCLGIGSIIAFLSIQFDYNQYRQQLSVQADSVSYGGSLAAEYDGQKQSFDAGQAQSLVRILTVSELKHVWSSPQEGNDAMRFTFDSGAELAVWPDPSDQDTALIHYCNNGRNRYYSISGYRCFSRLQELFKKTPQS